MIELLRPLKGNVLFLEFWVLSPWHCLFFAFNQQFRLGDRFKFAKAPHNFSAQFLGRALPWRAVIRTHVAGSAGDKQCRPVVSQTLLDILLNTTRIIGRGPELPGIAGITRE